MPYLGPTISANLNPSTKVGLGNPSAVTIGHIQ
jgi:hypothetical protein